MRNWHHSGFSVHNEVVIQKEDREALVRLAKYVVHASFSLEKIRYVEKTNCVMYKSRLHQGKKRNFEVLDAIEFLHRVCLHIPGHYEALIRYYGYYASPAKLDKILDIQNIYSKSAYVLNKGSNAARGKRKKLGLEVPEPLIVVDDAPDKKTCRRSWAQLVYQVYEVDPLKCPKCGMQMKIIAFILAREEVIRILKHLEMWPIEYPKPCPVEARASPFDFKLLRKLSD